MEVLLSDKEELTLKDVKKLHHQFGHVKITRLTSLIENAKRMTDKVRGYLKQDCTSCVRDQKSKPRPAVSLPRATLFNQVITIDLKDYKFICYLYRGLAQ